MSGTSPTMRIGIDASRTTVAQRTGTENYSLFLIRHLLVLNSDHSYALYFNAAPSDNLFPASAKMRARTMPFPRLWTHVRLSWEMVVSAPDVLFVPAHVLPIVHPRRSVVTVHDLGYLSYPKAHTRFARWYLNWSTRFNAHQAAHLIVDSQATCNDLVIHYGVQRNKITVVYPGVGPGMAPVSSDAELQHVRDRYHLPPEYLLFVGTLQPRKNLNALLEAFASVREQHPQVQLVLAGKRGWLYRSLFEKCQELGLEPYVHWIGYVPQDDLAALLSAARAFVLPSLYEGFGLPVLEAMACGTPVICSRVSSLPEVAGDAALLIDPNDPFDLANAMNRLLDDSSLRSQLSKRGLQQAARFSWETCAAGTLQVLEAVGRMPD
jgi:glycosyltransferase involved in cell wall biosynthesis